MKYVIIGNSAAGVGAVDYHTYSRPLISYLLLGKTTEEKMKYRDNDFYAKNNVKMLSASAKEIDAKSKQVVLQSGEKIPYDKLLVATGSSAFVPPFEGLDSVKEKYSGDVYAKTEAEDYKRLFYGNKLNGYILIRESKPLDSIDFKQVCEKPELIAFVV